MDDDTIYHICDRKAWQEAASTSGYRGTETDRRDGFLHFSTRDQVRESAAKHLRGIEGLVLLVVDPALLGEDLKWEKSRGGALFPHLYGPLSAAAVLSERDLPLGDDGRHVFPDDV